MVNLTEIDKVFTDKAGKCDTCTCVTHTPALFLEVQALSALWRKTTGQTAMENRVLTLPPDAATFKVKYDATQKQLQSIDDLLLGICVTSYITST